MKRDFSLMHADANRECLLRARDYLRTLEYVPAYGIIKYRTIRRWGYGVVVNKGDSFVMVWDAFSNRIEKMGICEFEGRFIEGDV